MAGLSIRIERDELHARMGGALPRGVAGLLEGEPGSGRSVLCQRLTFGALENRHRVSYLTTEHGTLGFLRQMSSLGYDVASPLSAGRLMLFPGFPALAPRAPPGDALARIVVARQLWRSELLVLDDLGALIMASIDRHGEEATQRTMAQLVERLRQANAAGTTVLMTTDRQGPHAGLLQPLRGAAEMLFEMQVELVGATLVRRTLIRRLAGAPERTGDTLGFRVEPGIGLLIEIRSVT